MNGYGVNVATVKNIGFRVKETGSRVKVDTSVM